MSAAREAFFLRGVLDYVSGRTSEGVAAFAHKPVAAHLRDLGQRLGILMLSGEEIGHWCQHLTNGVPIPGYFSEIGYDEYLKSWTRLGIPWSYYLHTDYWFHFNIPNSKTSNRPHSQDGTEAKRKGRVGKASSLGTRRHISV